MDPLAVPPISAPYNIKYIAEFPIHTMYFAVPGDFEGKKITSNGERAAAMFCRVECCTDVATAPFCWLFIRPPWASAGACCKECVFNNMKAFVVEVSSEREVFFYFYCDH